MRTIKLLLVGLIALPVMFVAQTGDRVFPDRSSVTGARPLDAFRQEWYSKHLNAMGEPRLPDVPNEAYRFLWLRTFEDPIMVRLTCYPNGVQFDCKTP